VFLKVSLPVVVEPKLHIKYKLCTDDCQFCCIVLLHSFTATVPGSWDYSIRDSNKGECKNISWCHVQRLAKWYTSFRILDFGFRTLSGGSNIVCVARSLTLHLTLVGHVYTYYFSYFFWPEKENQKCRDRDPWGAEFCVLTSYLWHLCNIHYVCSNRQRCFPTSLVFQN